MPHKSLMNHERHSNFFLSYINPYHFLLKAFFLIFTFEKILTFALRICSICLVLSGQIELSILKQVNLVMTLVICCLFELEVPQKNKYNYETFQAMEI